MNAVILAAGNSTRYGSNKLLRDVGGLPMYRHVTDILSVLMMKGVFKKVVFVTQYPEIAADVRRTYPLIAAVMNHKPDLGISYSMQLGLKKAEELDPGCEGCLFAVADQPAIKEESILHLTQTWRLNQKISLNDILGSRHASLAGSFLISAMDDSPAGRHYGICAVASERRIGNPVIFSSHYFPELYHLTGDQGGKKVLMRHLDDTVLVPVDERELCDIDTPEDGKKR